MMSEASKKLKNVCGGNGFALSLVLKQRLKATPKWHIGFERFHFHFRKTLPSWCLEQKRKFCTGFPQTTSTFEEV